MSLDRSPRQYLGVLAQNPPSLIITQRAPLSTDTAYRPGQLWMDKLHLTSYQWSGVSWIALGTGATSGIVTLTGGTGGAISPVAGNIILAGTANQITTTGSGHTITFSLPAAITAPGSLTVTSGFTVSAGTTAITGTTNINTSGAAITTIGTGGTGQTRIGNATGNTAITGSLTTTTTLTATLGAITATNGNLVFGTAGNKITAPAANNTATAGANSFGTVTLSSGTVTVATTAVTASSIIMLTRMSVGASTALGILSVGTIVASTSFVISAATQGTPGTPLAADASVIGWQIIN